MADDVKYSCNDSIDEWVKSNLSEIHKMTRADWLEKDQETGIAIFRAFTKKQKMDFWKAKFDEVLMLDWNESERAHIELAREYVLTHDSFFEDGELSDDQLDELDSFFFKWQDVAIRELGWTKKTIGAIVLCGNLMLDKEGNVRYNSAPPGGGQNPPGPVGRDCDCNKSHDFCLTFDCDKSILGCVETERGCGWILMQACNGSCGGI